MLLNVPDKPLNGVAMRDAREMQIEITFEDAPLILLVILALIDEKIKAVCEYAELHAEIITLCVFRATEETVESIKLRIDDTELDILEAVEVTPDPTVWNATRRTTSLAPAAAAAALIVPMLALATTVIATKVLIPPAVWIAAAMSIIMDEETITAGA